MYAHRDQLRSDAVRGRIPRWAVALLRVRLAWKLVLANAVVLGLAIALWEFLHVDLHVLRGVPPALIAVGLLVLSGALNAALVSLALRPVAQIEETAARVQRGDWSARTPASPLADPSSEGLRVLLNRILDDAERRRTAALRRTQAAFRSEERARGRLSEEMYADTAQSLAALLLQLRMVESGAENGSGAETAHRIANAVRTVLDDVRGMARRLRPPELDELGIRPALEAHVRRLGEVHAALPEIRILGDVPGERLGDEARLVLFRIVEEAVGNAITHAGASWVEVVLRHDDRSALVQVTDDGGGFHPREHLDGASGGLGLPSMFERARVCDATLTIDSTPGEGTCVSLALPWARLDVARRDAPAHL